MIVHLQSKTKGSALNRLETKPCFRVQTEYRKPKEKKSCALQILRGDDQSGACLALFPLAPGDLTEGSNSACEAAAMDVDVSAGDLPEMRLQPACNTRIFKLGV